MDHVKNLKQGTLVSGDYQLCRLMQCPAEGVQRILLHRYTEAFLDRSTEQCKMITERD